MSQGWFRRTHNFWVRIPVSPEGWAVNVLVFILWLVSGLFLDITNPTIINVISFILIGIFLYLIMIWVAHYTDETGWRL